MSEEAMENANDIAAALKHLGWESVADLHYWAQANDIERFEALCQSFAKHRRATEDALDAADEETFNIGKKEGREEAVQAIDLITGGDGEYRVSTIEGRNCPDADAMISNIEARFTALRAEIARLREASAALIADLREAMPHIDNAIHIAAIHHCPYKGKSLQPAMDALAAALGEQP